MITDFSHNSNIIHIQIVYDDGGVGDCIARLPVINYIEKHYPNVIVHLWVPPYFKDFAKRCVTSKVIIRDFTEVKKYKKELPTYAFARNHIKNIAMHMTDHAFHVTNFQPRFDSDKNYSKIDLTGVTLPIGIILPEKYAIICAGFTSPVREWLPEHINKVCDYLNLIGVTPVFLGKTVSSNGTGHVIAPVFREEIDFSKGINLIDQTTLVESAKIIQGSKLIVGLDNGLIHVAACLPTPIVVGYTTLFKEHRLPYRNGILGYGCEVVELTDEELSCRACQSKFCTLYSFDFKGCYKGHMKCLNILDSLKYIEAIERILKV